MDNFRLEMIMERPFKYFPVVIIRYQTNYWCLQPCCRSGSGGCGASTVLKELRGQGPRCKR